MVQKRFHSRMCCRHDLAPFYFVRLHRYALSSSTWIFDVCGLESPESPQGRLKGKLRVGKVISYKRKKAWVYRGNHSGTHCWRKKGDNDDGVCRLSRHLKTLASTELMAMTKETWPFTPSRIYTRTHGYEEYLVGHPSLPQSRINVGLW